MNDKPAEARSVAVPPVSSTVLGDFDDVTAGYIDCTLYVTANVTMPSASAVRATIEKYAPNEGSPGLLLTVWNSDQKPIPQAHTVTLGATQITR